MNRYFKIVVLLILPFLAFGQKFRSEIQDYNSVVNLRNETLAPKKNDKAFIQTTKHLYSYDLGNTTSPDDGLKYIVQTLGSYRWVCLNCHLRVELSQDSILLQYDANDILVQRDTIRLTGGGPDKFHTNILATAPYDPLNPLTGWVAPSGAITGNTVEVKFTDGTVANYTYDGTVWGLNFVNNTSTAQRPWIKVGNTIETSATDVLKTDEIYHVGKTTIGSSLNPLGILHVGDLNNVNSTKPGILLSKNINTTGVAEHGLVDNSILNNSQSYNSFDARININSNLLGSGDHYSAFQSIPVLNSGFTIDTYYGVFDRLANSGTVKNYFGASYLTPLGNCDNYIGVNVNRSGASTQSIFSRGFVAGNLNAPDVVGLDVFSLNGSNKTYGVRVANLLGNNRRPIYTKVEQSGVFSPNEFYYNNSGSADLLMFSRSSVGNGDYLGVLWEAGSGATKYYSNRFASSYDSSLRGDFVFHTNSTGASGLVALTEKARIQYDGSIIHQGYHQYTSTFPTSGAGVPNGSQFKGTDGALYYKGDGGTVTLVAPN